MQPLRLLCVISAPTCDGKIRHWYSPSASSSEKRETISSEGKTNTFCSCMIDPSANLWQRLHVIFHLQFNMGRKRNQGKARKAAKAAKAREEAEESRGKAKNDVVASEICITIPLYEPDSEGGKCIHNNNPPPSSDLLRGNRFLYQFLHSFKGEFGEAIERRTSVETCLKDAYYATRDKFAEMWKDSTKLTLATSFLLSMGTEAILGGKYDNARDLATFARFFEQDIAVALKRTQALHKWPKIHETYQADLHTLVKFYRHRIPCSCLDKKYEEVKHITKLGVCYNPQCSLQSRIIKRSNTMYCSRCRCATYCSRECQKADWSRHKPNCDWNAAKIAKLEAENFGFPWRR